MDIIDPISLKDIDESNEWLIGRMDKEEDEHVFNDDSLTWGDISRVAGAKVPQELRLMFHVHPCPLHNPTSTWVNLDDFEMEEEDTDD